MPLRLVPILLLVASCTRPTPPNTSASEHPPTPYGGYSAPDGLVLPRATLAHLTSSAPVHFEPEDDGARLVLDETGLLGQIGLFAGEVLLTNDVEATLDSWFSDARSELQVRRFDDTRTQTVTWDGPPTAPPSAPMTTLGEPEAEGVLQVSEGRTVSRSALVHLPASVAVPAREQGELVGYRLLGPVATALGVSELRAADGVALTSDEALFHAVERWFTQPESVVQTASGTVTLRWQGAPATPPAIWTLPIDIDVDEARARAGVVLAEGEATIHRSALTGLLRQRLSRFHFHPSYASGMSAQDMLTTGVAELLGLPSWTIVTAVNGQPVAMSTEADLARYDEVRQALLTDASVALTLAEGEPLVVRIQGDSLPLPDSWPEPPPVEPEPTRGVTLGPVVRMDRLTLRRLIGPPVACRQGRAVPPNCGAHPLWTAVGLPYSTITHLNDEPFTDVADIQRWVTGLCAADGGSMSSGRSEQVRVELHIDGPPVPCP